MKRALTLVLATMLLAVMIPAATVSAQTANDRGTKVVVCHNVGHNPVTITIAKAALKAHLRHHDTLGACTGTTPKPHPKPVQTPTACTFDAANSAYYNGPTSGSPLYATGPIHFSWTVASGLVTVPGGSWTETTVSPVATYVNNVSSGNVSAAGVVVLHFTQAVTSHLFDFNGTLTGNVLSGTADGNYLLTATGTVSCVGQTTPTTCTFDAITSAYHSDATSGSSVFATGPIHFSWTVATGLVTVPGGSWNEMAPPPPASDSATYINNISAGTVLGTGAVNLTFVRFPAIGYTFGFSGMLVGNSLTGLMGGNFFTATGTVSCTGTHANDQNDQNDRDDD